MNVLRFLVPKSLVETIDADSTVRQAIEKMRYHRYVAIPVLDGEGKYVGTLRNDDLFAYLLERGRVDFRAAEHDGILPLLDRANVRPLRHDASMEALIERVEEHNFVPVVDDRDCFIGIILRRDVLHYLLKFYQEENAAKTPSGDEK